MENSSLFALVFSAILVISGTAILWNGRTNWVADDAFARHSYNWDLVVFWLIVLSAGAAVVKQRRVFAIIAAGMFVGLAIYANTGRGSWGFINYCRAQDENTGSAIPGTRRCTSGGILAYTGIVLATLFSFLPYATDKKSFTSTLHQQLAVAVSVVFALIGSIVLWTSPGATASASNSNYANTIDVTIYTILATFYTFASVFNGSSMLLSAASFISASVFFFSFHDMFMVVENGQKESQLYAGFLFCWFSMITNIVVSAWVSWNPSESKITPQ